MIIEKLKFRDIKMTIIHDPVDKNRIWLVAATKITRNKLKENALKHKKEKSVYFISSFASVLGYKTDSFNRYNFFTTLMSYLLSCFTRLIAVPLQDL